ncbi:MAG TPA: hypothetical protein VG820_14075 [Fimbriimonadaceae bacterium]|nr:hypothetical protein [Fimbriimonadaceae bacterium]
MRTGAVLTETQLTPTNVQPGSFGLVNQLPVDGQVYGQPLVVSNVRRGLSLGAPLQDLVIVCTENDSVYCFDGKTLSKKPVWKVNLGKPVPYTDVGSEDMNPTIGIVSTPVVDRASHTLWVVAKTKDVQRIVPHYAIRLHALDLYTGQEKPNSPIEISGTVSGSADDGANGIVRFNALREMNRPGLLLDNGILYIAFASQGDVDPYHGWIFAYDIQRMRQVGIYCTTPDGDETYYLPSGAGGIWQAGQGLACDENHNVYCMSGNGAFSHDGSGRQTGNSFIKLHLDSAGLHLVDFFTPHDSDSMNGSDKDLGSSGVVIIPGTTTLVGSGKSHEIFVVNRDQMGGFSQDTDNCLQRLQVLPHASLTSPVYFNSPASGPTIYVGAVHDNIRAFHVNGALLESAPFMMTTNSSVGLGSMMSISANGQNDAILWAVQPESSNWGLAVLRAFDANDLSNELWNSDMNQSDAVGSMAKFCAPTIANGKVYVPTFDGMVNVYGLHSHPHPIRKG